ncbi:MAG: MFS transporter [Acidimicrobiales bacterium]
MSATDRAAADAPDRARWATVVVCVSVAVIGVNTTAVSVTALDMADELELGAVTLSWVVNAYLLTAASFALIGGRVGDELGRSRTLAIGCGVFTLGSLTAAVAPGDTVVLVGRVLQGLAAALVLPSGIEVLHATTPQRTAERRSYRWRGIVYATAFGVGPLVGAALTDLVGWRAFFVLEVLVMGALTLACFPLRSASRRGRRRRTDDLLGAVLAVPLVALLVLFAERALGWGLVWWPTLVVAVAILGLGVAFVHVERRRPHPLLHLSLLHRRRLVGANVAVLAASIGMVGLLYWCNLFAQSAAVFDATALAVVVLLAPFIVSIVAYTQLAMWLGHRFGGYVPVLVGLSSSVVGFWLLSRTGPDTTEAQLLVPLAVCGLGAGVANAGLVGAAVLDLPPGRLDEAAGITTLARFAGSALAIAIGSASFLAVAPGVEVAQAAQAVDAEQVALGGRSLDRSLAKVDAALVQRLLATVRADAAEVFARTMRVAAVVVLVLLVLATWLLRAGGPPPARGSST